MFKVGDKVISVWQRKRYKRIVSGKVLEVEPTKGLPNMSFSGEDQYLILWGPPISGSGLTHEKDLEYSGYNDFADRTRDRMG